LDQLTNIAGGVFAAFGYDGDGNRVTETANGPTRTYLIDTAAPLPVRIASTINNGGVERYFYGNERVLEIATDGTRRYQHTDGLGNVRLRTNTSGGIVDTSAYAPTGERLAGDGLFGFTGEPYSAGGLLVHLRARDYYPALGRFLTIDPYPPDAMEPRMFHAYLYGENNPINLTDPTGKCIYYAPECGAVNYNTLIAGLAPQQQWFQPQVQWYQPQQQWYQPQTQFWQAPSVGGSTGFVVPSQNPYGNFGTGLASLLPKPVNFNFGIGSGLQGTTIWDFRDRIALSANVNPWQNGSYNGLLTQSIIDSGARQTFIPSIIPFR
jgi:RHS repeat-associated protein